MIREKIGVNTSTNSTNLIERKKISIHYKTLIRECNFQNFK